MIEARRAELRRLQLETAAWEGVTYEGPVAEPGAYIERYGEGRIKQPLGWKSPTQYRKGLGLAA